MSTARPADHASSSDPGAAPHAQLLGDPPAVSAVDVVELLDVDVDDIDASTHLLGDLPAKPSRVLLDGPGPRSQGGIRSAVTLPRGREGARRPPSCSSSSCTTEPAASS
jgi:hypothetical protein